MQNVWFIIFYCLLTITKKAPQKNKKQKTKENKNKQTNKKQQQQSNLNTKCAGKLLQVRFAYIF